MTGALDRILRDYGQALSILHGGAETEAKGFLQPLTASSQGAPYQMTSVGAADDRRWRLLTRSAVADGDIVTCGGVRFTVRACAEVRAGAEFSHWWGMLEREREAAR